MSSHNSSRFYGSTNSDFEKKSKELDDPVTYSEREQAFFYESDDSIGTEDGLKSLLRSTVSQKSFSKSVSSNTSSGTLKEKLSEDRKSTLFMAVCNMLPVLQGSIVFGIPYAMVQGGLVFIPAFIILCLMADFSGLLLIECLYSVSPKSLQRKRVYADYKDVTKACWGTLGSKIVNTIFTMYVIANNVVNVVVVGKCLSDLLSNYIPFNATEFMLLSSVLITPLLFIRKLSVMAYFSLIAVSSIVIASLTSFGYMIYRHDTWSKNFQEIPYFDVNGFPLAIGIASYSIFLNCVLPQVEGSMKKPKQVSAAIHISFTVSTILKALFGLFGALTFGITTKQLVSQSISKQSTIAKFVISIALCGYSIPNYALIFYLVFVQIDELLKERKKFNIFTLTLTRISFTCLCVGIAIIVPYFALVSGVVGAITGTCFIFVFPVIYHVQLKWKETSTTKKVLEISLLVVGLVVGGLATYSSIVALVQAIAKDH